LVFNPHQMSSQEMLDRASYVFVGVIENQHFDYWPFFDVNLPGDNRASAKHWKVLRRRVQVETVIRGVEPRKTIDVYEIFWTGGTSGDWNSTRDGERALFLVRVENGHYHVVRDWWRSIFPITNGPHSRLPLDESRSLWERIALMNFLVDRNDNSVRITYPYFHYNDPGNALGLWREVKLERGLVRHPSSSVRVPACRELLMLVGWGQDECWESLSESEKSHLRDGGYSCCTPASIATTRRQLQERDASWWWLRYADRESRRLLTAVNNKELRTEICRVYTREYPGDQDTGCLYDRPPATIVTENGDVPLAGKWPTLTRASPRGR
jgi:hypothetical protein